MQRRFIKCEFYKLQIDKKPQQLYKHTKNLEFQANCNVNTFFKGFKEINNRLLVIYFVQNKIKQSIKFKKKTDYSCIYSG